MTQWIEQNAQPLALSDSEGALTDLEPLREMVGEASVVALGASTRDTHELSVLAHQVFAVSRGTHGVSQSPPRGGDATSAAMDRYVRSGEGDPRALLAEARSFWRTGETLDVVEWVRRYNQRHPEDLMRIAHPELDRRVTVQSRSA
ncbi:erythromycin esterase family protein [Nocardia jiangxiensis]|uniref:Erythromycin esterase family protein n=1 Tax=Nocardia jiangxiensis TaxID=282685 RepID=A0ABW6S054_9NOCA|nr:erythromycin esterase family protein [Nocardia jiangxiensis]